MNKIIVIVAIYLLIACNPKNNSNDPEQASATNSNLSKLKNDSITLTPQQAISLAPLWEINDDGMNITIKKSREEDSALLTPTHLTNIINHTWKDKVLLFFEKQSNDTAYVTIAESDYLTQKMGSTGAEAYMMSVVYTLTELKGVKRVNFNFVEGDHAVPGVYSRSSFKK